MKYSKLLFLLAIIFCLHTTYAQDYEEMVEIARSKQETGNYNYALDLMQKVLENDPADMENRLFLAEILLQLGRHLEAEFQLLLAIEVDSTYAETYNRLGEIFLARNDLERSVEYYNKAINNTEVDSMKFNYYLNLATAQGVLRDFDSAIDYLEKAYAIDTNNLLILNNLSMFYRQIGNLERGIDMLKKSIEIDPNFTGPYVNLGLIYSEIDSFKLSEFYFNKGIEIAPQEPLLYSNRGYLYYKQELYQKALKDINESLNLYPENSYAYRNRALVYLALGLSKEACRDLDIATRYDFATRYGNEVEKLTKEHCGKED